MEDLIEAEGGTYLFSMIHIFCALPCEAEPIVKALGLVRDKGGSRTRFEDENKTISLIITGVGKINMAVKVGYEAALSGDGDGLYINAGTAGSHKDLFEDGVYMINKVTDNDTGRSFYPDMTRIDDLKEAPCLCVCRPAGEDDMPEISLVDMESSAFYEAASMFAAPHKIVIIKSVSDNGDYDKVDKDRIRASMEKTVPYIRSVIRRELDNEQRSEEQFDRSLFDKVCRELKCTEYMKNSLRELFIYALSEDVDIKEILERMKDQMILPVTGKKEGISALEELKRRVIGN